MSEEEEEKSCTYKLYASLFNAPFVDSSYRKEMMIITLCSLFSPNSSHGNKVGMIMDDDDDDDDDDTDLVDNKQQYSTP